jgi:antagonist of KipI
MNMSGYLEAESPGLFTTVQDLGRHGYAHLGISAAGAADAMALRIGNLLVGNAEHEAGLEMTLHGGTFRFSEEAVVALTGSHSPIWQAVRVAAGDSFVVPGEWAGARSYLTVRGGFDLPLVLGSRSAHVRSGIGKALRRGDRIGIAHRVVAEPTWDRFDWPLAKRSVLRVTAGPQAAWFGAEFYDQIYEVRGDSDRMGVRLSGASPIQVHQAGTMLTEGVSLGAVQVPPGGEPIILFVDHQTTGGYPKVANVISADLWRVGQLRPHDRLRFELVTIEEALEVLRRQERMVESLR